MNYIGSKLSLLSEIKNIIIRNNVPVRGTAFDVFAGTAVVSRLLKEMGYAVTANDWQMYAYYTTFAALKYHTPPEFRNLFKENGLLHNDGTVSNDRQSVHTSNAEIVLDCLNNLQPVSGAFYDHYCDQGNAGRCYFSRENGMRIQAIRDHIEQWYCEKKISIAEKIYLTAVLIEASDKVANTASVYGAFLKHIKKTAQKRLCLKPLYPVNNNLAQAKFKVFNEDINHLLKKINTADYTLAYIDPPYNVRQYAANYHILETIAAWDIGDFTPRGKTGLRPADEKKSIYCRKKELKHVFMDLITAIKSHYVLFSYNNEGLLNQKDLKEIFSSNRTIVEFKKIKYQRFRSDMDHRKRKYKANGTEEYLILSKRSSG